MITSRTSINGCDEGSLETEDLLGEWPHLPYPGCPNASLNARRTYLFKAIRASQQRGASSFVAATAAGRWDELLLLEQLSWDSAILGMPVGRIPWWIHRTDSSAPVGPREELLQDALEEARQLGIVYLLARTPASDSPCIDLLQKNQFHVVDGLLTFGCVPDIAPDYQFPNSYRCELAEPGDIAALGEIAASSFRFDRFHMDPVIGKQKADHLHREWARNSCTGLADAVLVAKIGKKIAGFTTLKCDPLADQHLGVKIGTIVLVATAQAHRRNGIGKLLTRHAVDWFVRQRCQWCEVGTQLGNLPAARLYESAGFRLTNTSVTLRRLL